jgi:hypothetical protein
MSTPRSELKFFLNYKFSDYLHIYLTVVFASRPLSINIDYAHFSIKSNHGVNWWESFAIEKCIIIFTWWENNWNLRTIYGSKSSLINFGSYLLVAFINYLTFLLFHRALIGFAGPLEAQAFSRILWIFEAHLMQQKHDWLPERWSFDEDGMRVQQSFEIDIPQSI